MAILRNRTQCNFTIVNNVIFDGTLSLKAIGLLTTMLHLPDGWQFSEVGLTKIVKDGITAVHAALKELERAGYLIRTQSRDGRGQFCGYDWEVYDTPQGGISSEDDRTQKTRERVLRERKTRDNKELKKKELRKREVAKATSLRENKQTNSGAGEPGIPKTRGARRHERAVEMAREAREQAERDGSWDDPVLGELWEYCKRTWINLHHAASMPNASAMRAFSLPSLKAVLEACDGNVAMARYVLGDPMFMDYDRPNLSYALSNAVQDEETFADMLADARRVVR